MSVLALFGAANDGGPMHLFFAFCGIFCIAVYIVKCLLNSNIFDWELFLLFAILLFFIVFMIVCPLKYGYTDSVYKSMYLTFGSASIPAFLMGIMARKRNLISDMMKWLPPFIIILTFASFIVTLSPSGQTSGGFVSDESGLMYQNCSYYSAFAFGLNILYLKFYDSVNHFKPFSSSKFKILLKLMPVVEVVTVFLSGGRGGCVVLFLFIIYAVFVFSRNSADAVRNLFLVLAAGIVVLFVLPKVNIATNGINRIFNGLTSDSSRDILKIQAIEAGNRHYIFGNGPGSVFYELEIYSHNIFTDFYCEMGTVGVLLYSVLIVVQTCCLIRLIKENKFNHLVMIIFLSAFVFLQFSSYYISVPGIWFTTGYVFSKTPQNLKLYNAFER